MSDEEQIDPIQAKLDAITDEFDAGLTKVFNDLHEKHVKDEEGHDYAMLLKAALDVLSRHLGEHDGVACSIGVDGQLRAQLRHDAFMMGKEAAAEEHDLDCPDKDCEGLAALKRELLVN